jgi:nucleotide-binding universal stress UspA family protein
MYKHLLLPTDGSELSEKAIRSGIQLAKALNAKVTGLCVIVDSLVAKGIGKSMHSKEEDVQAAETYLRVILNEAKRQNVPHECFYATAGAVSDEIIKVASDKGCDLIFMASHGRRGIGSLLMGSETMHVLTHSKIPVLVYR